MTTLDQETALQRIREAARVIREALESLPDVREVMVSVEGMRIIRVVAKPGQRS